jgi:hypothetical protein
MGFIGLKLTRDSAVIRGAPAIVSYGAFSMLVEMLEDQVVRRLALSWFDGRWHDETFFGSGTTKAKKRLLELMLQLRRRPDRYYLSYPRELGSIVKNHPHKNLLDYWRDVQGRIDPAKNSDKLYELTNGKFLTVQRKDNGKLAFTSIGKGLIVYRDNSWATQFAGGPVEDQPDYLYGQWIASGYQEALTVRNPSIADFDAVVRDARNGNSQHHRYARLLLPIETANGDIQLLSAPRADTSIDLSFEG